MCRETGDDAQVETARVNAAGIDKQGTAGVPPETIVTDSVEHAAGRRVVHYDAVATMIGVISDVEPLEGFRKVVDRRWKARVVADRESDLEKCLVTEGVRNRAER